ncbi:translation initiation factor eIF3 core subunit j [Saccharomyces paradoxus]|uniref:Eukaryotic translation initiation factor 3 subunit J n=1 Tax=Saccharomyces paradoxus TaxID=27291 RepID=A0A8B8UW05_SACPA|nr:Hcr1 [Saccharomyces paradoxus]QHS74918.1 Hcr1 [Saccharomyces paradoxus]
MSWDDEAINGSMGNDDVVLMDSWDAEIGDDEPVMQSWDAEEEEKKPTPKPKKEQPKKAKKGKESSTDRVLLDIDTLDEKTRKELIKKAEMESDLNNAADLFAGLGVAEEHPRARALQKEQEEQALKRPAFTKDTPIETHPLFNAESKREYQDLRKALSAAITPMNKKSPLNYSSSLAIDLIRDVAKPMSIESIRQTVATLNVLIKDKEREERQARLARVRGGTATGGAGKKKVKGKTNLGGAFKKDQDFDLDGADDFEFGDDDFM